MPRLSPTEQNQLPVWFCNSQLRSLPLNLTACPYFCSFVISWSPCLTMSWYCLFLSSGRFVSMTSLTRSIVQGTLFPAMNFARSLFEVSRTDSSAADVNGFVD